MSTMVLHPRAQYNHHQHQYHGSKRYIIYSLIMFRNYTSEIFFMQFSKCYTSFPYTIVFNRKMWMKKSSKLAWLSTNIRMNTMSVSLRTTLSISTYYDTSDIHAIVNFVLRFFHQPQTIKMQVDRWRSLCNWYLYRIQSKTSQSWCP